MVMTDLIGGVEWIMKESNSPGGIKL